MPKEAFFAYVNMKQRFPINLATLGAQPSGGAIQADKNARAARQSAGFIGLPRRGRGSARQAGIPWGLTELPLTGFGCNAFLPGKGRGKAP